MTSDIKAFNPPLAIEWSLMALALTASALLLYPGWPLALVTGTICLVGGFLRQSWLLYALLFFLPMAPLLKSDLPFEDLTSVLRILASLAVFAGCVFRREALPPHVFRNKLSLLALLYLMIVAASAARNGISAEAHRSLFHLCSYIVFYFGMLAWIRTQDQLRSALRTLVVSSVLVSLFAFYQFVSDSYTDLYFWLYPDQLANVNAWDGRVTSVLNYSNCLGGFMAMLAGFALALAALDDSPPWKRFGKVAFFLAGATILFSQSRGALAGFLVVVLLGTIYFAKTWKERIAWMGGTLLTIKVSLPLLASFSQHLTVKGDDVSVVGRLIVFSSAIQLFFQSPIVGIGYGNFRNLMDFDVFDLQANSWDAHNLYLQLLAETGILGFLAFAGLLLLALWCSRKLFMTRHDPVSRLLGFATLAALCSVAVHGGVDYLFNASSQFGTLFWMALAMVAAAMGLSSRVPNQPQVLDS